MERILQWPLLILMGQFLVIHIHSIYALSTGVVEYADCISTERYDAPPQQDYQLAVSDS